MDIAQQINSSVQGMIESGKLKQMVEKNLEETLQSTIKESVESFFRWGEGGKTIEKVIKESLKFDVATLALPDYRDLILNRVRDLVDQEMSGIGAEKIRECVDKIKGDYPAEISIEKLFEKFFEEEFDEDDLMEEQEITINIDADKRHLVFIYFDKDSDKKAHNCAHRLVIHPEDGRIHSYEYEGRSKNTLIRFGEEYGFKNYLFGLYAAGTKITGAKTADPSDMNRHIPMD